MGFAILALETNFPESKRFTIRLFLDAFSKRGRSLLHDNVQVEQVTYKWRTASGACSTRDSIFNGLSVRDEKSNKKMKKNL